MNSRSTSTRGWLVFALLVVTLSGATTACLGRPMFLAIGTAIDILPSGYVSIVVGAERYYYHRGMFYRPFRWGYVVVPAPLGAVVVAPPPGHILVRVERTPYHYYRGVFYQPYEGRYRVVRPPPGAFVPSLPDNAVSRRVGGVEYKEYAGTWYRPALRDGRRGYLVSEAPDEGAGR